MDGGVHECVADGGIDIPMDGVLEGGKIFTVTFNLYNSGFLNKQQCYGFVLLCITTQFVKIVLATNIPVVILTFKKTPHY